MLKAIREGAEKSLAGRRNTPDGGFTRRLAGRLLTGIALAACLVAAQAGPLLAETEITDQVTVSFADGKRAVKLTLPVFCGYIVLGIAFGATLAQAGYGPVWALAISTLVYAGSLQFVMVPFLAGGTSLIAVALTALMVNARHLFYGLSCIERFGRMDKRIRPYMITSLTDETYSVFCGLSGDEEDGVMFRVTLYDQIYWVSGSILGTLLAQGLPFDLTGIDFSMTALFVVICVEKALEMKNRVPMAIGAVCALAMLFLLGPSAFLAPALGLTAVLLTVMDIRKGVRA